MRRRRGNSSKFMVGRCLGNYNAEPFCRSLRFYRKVAGITVMLAPNEGLCGGEGARWSSSFRDRPAWKPRFYTGFFGNCSDLFGSGPVKV
jgi:hypothetical protein